jgi:hypothetical protein
MVETRVASSLWFSQFEELNEMLSKVQIGNSLCAFHMICTILDGINNFLSTLQDSRSGKLILLIAIWFHPTYHNPNLGLLTKARVCKSVGQEGGPGGTSYTPESVGECEKMSPHTPK